MHQLPDWPKLPAWEPAPDYITHPDIQYNPGATFPLRKLKDGRVMIDACLTRDGSIEMRAWERANSPAFAALKAEWPHIPRAVLAPYMAENILAVWRATESIPILRMMNAQIEAWRLYHRNRQQSRPAA